MVLATTTVCEADEDHHHRSDDMKGKHPTEERNDLVFATWWPFTEGKAQHIEILADYFECFLAWLKKVDEMDK
ncbi:hypothetical protein KIN20_032461 [Parelaphostrongylus tenuis]|uniref:Uncharacterized protein n=1 Tax=Parelaphostrongylus tenuis TaxID=148309 RepID=A0AAD5R6M0_PARTN|nr:hypothetical protein KIN20_032461 [Parelaphostrongylus tenuis]